MTRRLIWNNTISGEGFSITNGGCPESGLLSSPVPGVAYIEETDHVYFNNVCLPQHGGPAVVNAPLDAPQ